MRVSSADSVARPASKTTRVRKYTVLTVNAWNKREVIIKPWLMDSNAARRLVVREFGPYPQGGLEIRHYVNENMVYKNEI